MRKMGLILRRVYRSHFLGFELLISIIIISLATFLISKFLGLEVIQTSLNGIRDVLYGTLMALSGALLGFVITGLSVLLTTNNTEQLEKLKRSKHYRTIFVIFFSTSKYLGLLFVFSLLSLILDQDSSPVITLTILTFWGLTIVTLRVLRCIWVLEKIVSLHILKK